MKYCRTSTAEAATTGAAIDAGTRAWLRALAAALPASKAAAVAARATGLPRDALYAELMRGKGDSG